MVLNEIFYRKSGEGRFTYYNPADVELKHDDKGQRTGAVLKSDGKPVESDGIGTMSKSKNNGVDPQDLIDKYGADTARFFIMSTSPPEMTLLWSDAGVAGASRFLNRLWESAYEFRQAIRPALPPTRTLANARLPEGLAATRREVHLNLKQASFDVARSQFNTVTSACQKILNALRSAPNEPAATRAEVFEEGLSILLLLLSPICPHVSHYLWRELGFGEDVLKARWPEIDTGALEQDEIELVLQVNGKLRGHMRAPKSADRGELERLALAHEAVTRFTDGQRVKKVVVVPGRLVNVVV
jgi:leucyl-tRNA synthetase